MKTLQELKNEAIYDYIDDMVDSLSKDLKGAFEKDLARFVIDKEGNLSLKIEPNLDDKQAEEIYLAICKFIDTNPSPCFEQVVLH